MFQLVPLSRNGVLCMRLREPRRRHLCYQYEIAFWDSSIYQPQEIYDTADKTLNVGIEMVKVVIGYQ